MKIAVAKEHSPYECRVALTPEGVKKCITLGYNVFVEKNAGERAGFDDDAYKASGAIVEEDLSKLFGDANITLRIQPPSAQEIAYLPPHSSLIGLLKPHMKNDELNALAREKVTSFALEMIPRITRAQSMDVLSSQSNLAGYRAVIEGAHALNRTFPMMMTPAGTIAPMRVLILGAGVAGLQAIATAKRLGAIVSAFDVRSAAKEQVESLGATFIAIEAEESGDGSGGYAKEMGDAYQKAQKLKLTDVLKTQDLVITTAQIPMKKAPILIDEDMVSVMKSGSMIIDLASETGGNCTLTKHGETVTHGGTQIYAPLNIMSAIAYDASQLFSRNNVHFITNLIKEGQIQFDDEIVKATCLTHEGAIIHPLFSEKRKGD